MATETATRSDVTHAEDSSHGRHSLPNDGATHTVQQVELTQTFRMSPEFAAWNAAIQHDPFCPLTVFADYLTRDLLQPGTSHVPQATLIGRQSNNNWDSLGVLVPKSIRLSGISGTWNGGSLQGFRLAGSHLSGEAQADPTNWLREALSWVAKQHSDFLMIEDLISGSPLHQAMSEQVRSSSGIYSPTGVQSRWLVEFDGDQETYWNCFSSKTKQGWRRKWKRLEQPDIVRVTDISQVAMFLEAACEVSRETWQTQQLGQRVRVDDREMALFTWLAQEGLLRSYLLTEAGRPIAFLIGTQYRGHFSYEEVGYLPSESRNSPGQMLLIEAIKDLWSHDTPRVLDFGGGDADYKRSFATREEQSGTYWLIPPRLKPRLAVAELQVRRRLGKAARKVASAAGVRSRLRKLYRRCFSAASPPNAEANG